MTKEKQASLSKYVQELKNRMSSPIPAKHAGHPATFKAFLEKEIAMTQAKLDEAKLTEVK